MAGKLMKDFFSFPSPLSKFLWGVDFTHMLVVLFDLFLIENPKIAVVMFGPSYFFCLESMQPKWQGSTNSESCQTLPSNDFAKMSVL